MISLSNETVSETEKEWEQNNIALNNNSIIFLVVLFSSSFCVAVAAVNSAAAAAAIPWAPEILQRAAIIIIISSLHITSLQNTIYPETERTDIYIFFVRLCGLSTSWDEQSREKEKSQKKNWRRKIDENFPNVLWSRHDAEWNEANFGRVCACVCVCVDLRMVARWLYSVVRGEATAVMFIKITYDDFT